MDEGLRMRADLISFCERSPLSWAVFAQVDGSSESDAEAGWSGAQDQAERFMRSWTEAQANRVERSG